MFEHADVEAVSLASAEIFDRQNQFLNLHRFVDRADCKRLMHRERQARAEISRSGRVSAGTGQHEERSEIVLPIHTATRSSIRRGGPLVGTDECC